jgi:peptidoglycan L-alanyl-D-glutamate endopeptidase CwlK
MTAYRLGAQSEANLSGVHPDLVACVRRAISRTSQDFGVFEGMRTHERQKKLFAAGASRTLDSYHLTGDAVDCPAYIDGRLLWQLAPAIRVARAMHEASVSLSVPIVWGAVWDRMLASLDAGKLEQAVNAYVTRYRLSHPPRVVNGVMVQPEPLIDHPHFQRVRPG